MTQLGMWKSERVESYHYVWEKERTSRLEHHVWNIVWSSEWATGKEKNCDTVAA